VTSPNAPAVDAGSPGPTPIQRVRGTNDYLPPADARLRELEAELRSGFESFGYEGIQTPIIEPLELFLRKSGDALIARMYAFSHWNRRLCLRPELTASVMRAYVSELHGRSLPVRLHYGGVSFRYERPSRARYRQFTQVGVELIGAAGPAADAEILQLACAGLERAGVRRYRLVVGHLGVVLQLLRQLGMSEHGQGLILDDMEPLARGRIDVDAASARVVGLLGGPTNGVDATPHTIPASLTDLPAEEATAIWSEILRRSSLPLDGGVRQPQQIIQRLLTKASRRDPTEQVRAAFEFVLQLRDAAGPPARLQELRSLLEARSLSTTPLEEIETALDLLAAARSPGEEVEIEVDLSLARGLRYYTGLVFEIYVESADGPLQVVGGGRYDELIRALGGRESVPACGFSYGLERVELVRPAPSPSAAPRRRALVVPIDADDCGEAFRIADELRAAGLVVEQDVRLRGPKAALRHADRTAVDLVAFVGAQERVEGVVVLRDMQARSERRVPRAELVEAVGQ
jgi:histidyl-tRNA synthetase